MVVNRKQPTVPAPAISRSSSTQPIPTTTTTTKKATKSTSKSTLGQNGSRIDSRKSSSAPSAKVSKHKKRKSASFFDRLFLLSLSLFAFYTFYTCRPNPLFPSSPPNALAHDPNALCRSLATYRTHILDPYVLPSLKFTLSKTHALAEPYISQTQTHIEPYIAPVVSTAKTLKPYVNRVVSISKSVWDNSLVPFYFRILKPYWQSAVVPRYNMYIQPRIVPLQIKGYKYYRFYIANPLRIQALKAQLYIHNTYTKHVAPFINKAQPHVEHATITIYDGTARAVDFYQARAHPRVLATWKVSRPYLFKAWKLGKQYAVIATEITQRQLAILTKELGSLRRTYVDPHIIKIWDKVVEGTEVPPSTTPTTTTQFVPAVKVETTTESIITPTPSNDNSESETTPIAITAQTPLAEVKEEIAAEATNAVPEEVAENASTAPGIHAGSQTAKPHPPPIDAEGEVSSVVTTATISSVAVTETDAPVAEPEEEVFDVDQLLAEEPTTSASAASNGGADDIDAFLQELTSEEDAAPAGAAEDPVSIEINQNAEQQQPKSTEDQLALIAAKRLDIVTRHESWFSKLDEAVAEESVWLVNTLQEIRDEKVKELEGLQKKGALNDVQKDGEKLVRGLESYLKKAQGRKATWKIVKGDDVEKTVESKKEASNKEKDRWSTVIGKVEEKFSDRVRKLQGEVHEWYVAEREKEGQQIANSVYRVKNVAERGQADIGLDYAWLEDVTYLDWQRYHDLIRVGEKWQDTAYAIQNGTDANAPEDPIVSLLDLLDKELQDVVLGFQVAMGSIKSEALGLFSIHEKPEDEEEDSGFFVVKDGQVRKDDLRGVDLNTLDVKKKEGAGVIGTEKEDEVHILPIDPTTTPSGSESEETTFDTSKVVIGKDAVQVQEALKEIPIEPARSQDEL